MVHEFEYKPFPGFSKVYLVSFKRDPQRPVVIYESIGDGFLRIYLSTNLEIYPEKQLYSMLTSISRENSKNKPTLFGLGESELNLDTQFNNLVLEMGFVPLLFNEWSQENQTKFPLPKEHFDLILVYDRP